jgi:hypothetical protein
MIQDEGVRVEVGDEGNQGDTKKGHVGALPSLENRVRQGNDFGGACVVEIYFVLVVDGHVARFSKFAGAEEQVADQSRDNIDIPGGHLYIMEQFVDGGCWGDGAIWEEENHGGYMPSWKGWV